MSTAAEDRAVSFARDIKPLFRRSDRAAMTFAFDLWDVAQVRSNAEMILGRLEEGTMPCDAGWPPENVQLFRRWIATGKLD